MSKRYRYKKPKTTNTSFFESTISESKDLLIKNYLLKLYSEEIKSKFIKVKRILGLNTADNLIPRYPMVSFNSANNNYAFNDSVLLFSVSYLEQDYEFCFIITREAIYEENYFVYNLKISGLSKEANRPEDCLNAILIESISNSSFTNNVCSYRLLNANNTDYKFIESLKIIEPKPVNTDDIFLPGDKKEQIQRFIYAIKNYKNDKVNLRYLLSGPPGTGKTQIMNSIISSVKNEITVILTEGSSFSTNNLFEFSSLFDLTLLVIDDVDFLIGNRADGYNRKSLGAFLQYLDGFLPNNIFLLASTNDKNLVDYAASRPGRFDLVLDISEIHHQNYIDLVQRETDDEEIIRLFDDSTLSILKSKKVSGAFIVSLIKQLKSLKKMNSRITREDFENMINLTHRGFYNSNSGDLSVAVGF